MAFSGHHPRSTKRLYTVLEAATSLGISRTRLHQLVAAGAIVSVKVGRRRMFSADALDAYVSGLRPARPTTTPPSDRHLP
ncbi:MAG: helix-turn-helix domain-containing protein [Acidimicrobiales bacterium]